MQSQDRKNLTVINFFGGPGIGKSTHAAGLFSLMKSKKYLVELVQEYAKELVFESRNSVLDNDQGYLLSKQNRRLMRLVNNVDFAIVDSPLLLNCIYNSDTEIKSFDKYCIELFNSYHNINILLKRTGEYSQIGRLQTEEEAIAIDNKIKEMLKSNGIKFTEKESNWYTNVSILYTVIMKQLS